MIWGLSIIILTVILDQISKFGIDTQLIADKPIIVGEYFNLVKVWNTGVSFSMFNGYGEIGRGILVVFALLVVLFLLNWMRKEKDGRKIVCLAMIIGGALGNVIDRIRVGAVLDFLDFHYADMHWPAFNLADTFICIGAVMMILFEINEGRQKGADKI